MIEECLAVKKLGLKQVNAAEHSLIWGRLYLVQSCERDNLLKFLINGGLYDQVKVTKSGEGFIGPIELAEGRPLLSHHRHIIYYSFLFFYEITYSLCEDKLHMDRS